jgi:MoaA/NifB/PqqE/SkfB family radical SAM enzyme
VKYIKTNLYNLFYLHSFTNILPKALKEKIKPIKRELIPMMSRIKRFQVNKPTLVDLEITNRCNLRCDVCWFWGKSGIGDRYGKLEMSTDEIYTLIDEVRYYKPSIYIGGGEPFVRDDIFKILEYIKNCGLTISLTTNGTLLDDDKIEKIVELGIDGITFSVDGDEKLHDDIRGIGTFKKVTRSIKSLFRYK